MGEAGSFPEALFAVRAGFVQLRISLVGVSLENAARVSKVVLHMLRITVGSKAIDHTRRRRPVPREFLPDITPSPARTSVVKGQSVSVRVYLGGRSCLKTQ